MGIYTYPSNGSSAYAVLSTNPGIPDLLTEVDNGLGASIEYEYTSSSEAENTSLPFVMQNLSAVTVNDGLGNSATTEYYYIGGKYIPEEREFRGFSTVARFNPDETSTMFYYHQVDDFLKGRLSRIRQRCKKEFTFTIRMPFGREITRTTTQTAKQRQIDFTWTASTIDSGCKKVQLTAKVTREFENSLGSITLNEILNGQTPELEHEVFLQIDQDYTYNNENGLLTQETISGSDDDTGAGPSIRTTYAYGQPAGTSEWLWRLEEEAVYDDDASAMTGKTTYSHDNYGNVTGVEYWLGGGGTSPSVSYTYDYYGNRLTFNDARGYPWTTTYDSTAHAYPVTEQNPLGHTTARTWDQGLGVPLTFTDANNYTTTFTYDAFGRLTQTDAPDGGMTEMAYNDAVCPRTVLTRVWDSGATYIDSTDYMDGLGRNVQHVESTENSLFAVTQTEYDEMGRVDYQVGPFFNGTNSPSITAPTTDVHFVSTEYDHFGRPVIVITPDSNSGVAETEYEYLRTQTTVTDPDGGVTTSTADYLGRTVSIAEVNGSEEYTTAYSYDALGRLTGILDDKGNTISTAYDTLGRKTQMVHPDMGTWTYSYDANGNLAAQTGPTTAMSFDYDALNRITTRYNDMIGGRIWSMYQYDSAVNGTGRLHQVYNMAYEGQLYQPESAYHVPEYDSMGRIASDVYLPARWAAAQQFRYTYDLAGRPASMEYPDGFEVDYTYIPGTNLWSQVIAGAEVLAEFSGYTAHGKYEMVDYANGVTTQHTYDPDSTRLMAVQTSHGAADYQNYAYTYTQGGNIASIADNMRSHAYTYAYDDLHRLTSEASTTGAMAWTYDSIGNILSKSQDGSSMAYSYDGVTHRLDAVEAGGTTYNYTYDAAGNITSCPKFEGTSIAATLAIDYNMENKPSPGGEIRVRPTGRDHQFLLRRLWRQGGQGGGRRKHNRLRQPVYRHQGRSNDQVHLRGGPAHRQDYGRRGHPVFFQGSSGKLHGGHGRLGRRDRTGRLPALRRGPLLHRDRGNSHAL